MWSDILPSKDEDWDIEDKYKLEYFKMFHQRKIEIIQKRDLIKYIRTILV